MGGGVGGGNSDGIRETPRPRSTAFMAGDGVIPFLLLT